MEEGRKEAARGRVTQVGVRCCTKEDGRNNAREINSRDAVTGNRHIQYREIQIGEEMEERERERGNYDQIKQEIRGRRRSVY